MHARLRSLVVGMALVTLGPGCDEDFAYEKGPTPPQCGGLIACPAGQSCVGGQCVRGGASGGASQQGDFPASGGSTSTPAGGASDDVCPGVSANNPNACTQCNEGSCCAELTACLGDAACAGCIGGDAAQCPKTSLDDAFDACQARHCASVCFPTDACPYVSGDTSCAACLETTCCAEFKACSEEAACQGCLDKQESACAQSSAISALSACFGKCPSCK